MKRTSQALSTEQTTSPSPIIKTIFKIIKKNDFDNFEGGQRVLEFGQCDGKMYYKIQKDISKKYSGTGPKVIVTLGPTSFSKGHVPGSADRPGEYGSHVKAFLKAQQK